MTASEKTDVDKALSALANAVVVQSSMLNKLEGEISWVLLDAFRKQLNKIDSAKKVLAVILTTQTID